MLLGFLELVDELFAEEVRHVAVDSLLCQVLQQGVVVYGAVFLKMLVGAFDVAGCVHVWFPGDESQYFLKMYAL